MVRSIADAIVATSTSVLVNGFETTGTSLEQRHIRGEAGDDTIRLLSPSFRSTVEQEMTDWWERTMLMFGVFQAPTVEI